MPGTTTANDFPALTATEEEINRFDLDSHLVNLLLHEPFFSALLRNVAKIRTEVIPTAGVTVVDGNFSLFWNPGFVAALENREVRGLLKHESYHLVFDHCVSRKREPHLLWNWATDLAINSLIPTEELPTGALIPGKELDLTKVKDPTQLEKWKKVSDLIESLPLKQASEWYMTKLQQDKEISKIIEEGGKGEVGSLDDHDAWGDLSEEDRQVLKGKMKKALADAVKQSDRTGQWGSVDGETREKLRQMASSAVDWKKVLHNFCGRSQRSTKRRTHKRINRKYPYIHPGITRGHTSKVAIYFDQSGSVSKEECELFFGALSQLAKITTFKVFPFDYSVDDEEAFIWKRGQKVDPKRARAGGTSFQAVQKHFDTKCIGEFDGLIILTDGECSDPGPSLKRRCWVLLPGRHLYFDPSPGDIVVQMDNPRTCS